MIWLFLSACRTGLVPGYGLPASAPVPAILSACAGVRHRGPRSSGVGHAIDAQHIADAVDHRNGGRQVVGLEPGAQPVCWFLAGAGLLALDVVPGLRRFVARRMMFGARNW